MKSKHKVLEVKDLEIIDFRSDTITIPTEEMRRAMYEAEVGDDIYREDKTVIQLEEYAAEKVGKEAAIFVTSGTMGNQLALLAHCKRGQEIIVEEDTHIYNAEVGATSFVAGLQAKTIKGDRGIMAISDIEAAIRSKDIHLPETGLICIENTHNMAGGVVTPLEHLRKIYQLGENNFIPIHMDGARIFNAAIYLDCDVKKITQYCDSVMFCLSKGLCAPIGSILAGEKNFIERARRFRKMLGGGMRQAGVIAAPGLIALKYMVDRLVQDHENARKLVEGLVNIRGLKVDKGIQTNIIMVDVKESGFKSYEITDILKERGILANVVNDRIIRFVTHRYITSDNIKHALKVLNNVFSSLSPN